MEVFKTIILVAIVVIIIGLLGLILAYNVGKEMTYHRPCGGGRHRG